MPKELDLFAFIFQNFSAAGTIWIGGTLVDHGTKVLFVDGTWKPKNEIMDVDEVRDDEKIEYAHVECLTMESGMWIPQKDCKEKHKYVCAVEPVKGPCDDGWVYYKETNKCYQLQNWYQAQEACQHEQGNLASIEGPREYKFIQDTFKDENGFWIGLIEKGDGIRRWVDGSTSTWTPDRMAGSKRRIGHGEYCTRMDDNLKWNQYKCKEEIGKAAVCKKNSNCLDKHTTMSTSSTRTTTASTSTTISMTTKISRNVETVELKNCSEWDCWDYDKNYAWMVCHKVCKGATLSWDDAEKFCQSQGGTLPSIPNMNVSKYLGRMPYYPRLFHLLGYAYNPDNYSFWIGLHQDDRYNQNGEYRFSSDEYPVQFTHWDVGQPQGFHNGKAENCVGAYYGEGNDGVWNDFPCEEKKGFICQKGVKKNSTSTSTPTTTITIGA